MPQLPTPPLSRGVSAEPPSTLDGEQECVSTLDEKFQLLDSLLERYLHLLDRHQKLQESLGKQLSSGFFQLTHANYVSPSRRFGEDFYDERMKATRRLKITLPSTGQKPECDRGDAGLENVLFEVNYKSVLDPDSNKDQEAGEESESTQTSDSAKTAQNQISNNLNDEQNNILDPAEVNRQASQSSPTTAATPSPTTENSSEKKRPARKIFRSDDPISWYGILVPPSLRSAQNSFTDAVTDGIPQLLTVINEMQYVESLVHGLRRQMQETNE